MQFNKNKSIHYGFILFSVFILSSCGKWTSSPSDRLDSAIHRMISHTQNIDDSLSYIHTHFNPDCAQLNESILKIPNEKETCSSEGNRITYSIEDLNCQELDKLRVSFKLKKNFQNCQSTILGDSLLNGTVVFNVTIDEENIAMNVTSTQVSIDNINIDNFEIQKVINFETGRFNPSCNGKIRWNQSECSVATDCRGCE